MLTPASYCECAIDMKVTYLICNAALISDDEAKAVRTFRTRFVSNGSTSSGHKVVTLKLIQQVTFVTTTVGT